MSKYLDIVLKCTSLLSTTANCYIHIKNIAMNILKNITVHLYIKDLRPSFMHFLSWPDFTASIGNLCIVFTTFLL